jgi:hypothetical protein
MAQGYEKAKSVLKVRALTRSLAVRTPWEFGLIDASTNSPNWDKATCDEHHLGKGKWLYEPASDDLELCPGGDWSRYE